MSVGRTIAVGVVSVLLATTLVTGNLVAAAHLTVLNPNFVTDGVEAEGGYEVVENATRRAAGVDASAAETGPVETSSLVQNALSEEYVESQTEANVDRAYAYLHGNSDELNLSMSTEPIRENVSDGVERQLRNASVVELVERSGVELSGPVNRTVLERLTANRSSYRQVKADVRTRVRDGVLDAAVDRTFENASNDELIRAMGEDPDEYTERQKERFVAEYESEIRSRLRERIGRERGDEIDARVETELASMRRVATNASAETERERAAAAVRATVARGLTTDVSYRAFRENLSTAKAELAAVTADRVEQRLAAEMPARVDLTGNASSAATQGFENARTAVQWLDRLAYVLPVLALAFVGLLYHLRRSVTAVASDAGISMLVAGLPTVLGVGIARSRLRSMAASAPPERRQVLEVLTGVAGRALGTVGDLALALALGGAVLVAGSLAVRYGLVDALRERLDGGGGETL